MGKKEKDDGPKYNYMDTYGDLVTLLLCFFVLLFSMSTVETEKYNAFVEALASRFGGEISDSAIAAIADEDGSKAGDDDAAGDVVTDENLPADLNQLFESIADYTEQSGMQGEVQLDKSPSGATFIRLSNNMLFDGNSSNLKPNVHAFLDFLSDCFNSVESEVLQVKFYGHTASVAGSGVDDWMLSAERASKVASYVNNTGGFNRFKIQFSGFGRNYPIADNETSEGRAKNRRVDIIVLSNDSERLQMTLAEAMRVYFPGDNTDFFQGEQDGLTDEMIEGGPPTELGVDVLSGLTDEQVAELMDQAESMADQNTEPSVSVPEKASSG